MFRSDLKILKKKKKKLYISLLLFVEVNQITFGIGCAAGKSVKIRQIKWSFHMYLYININKFVPYGTVVKAGQSLSLL